MTEKTMTKDVGTLIARLREATCGSQELDWLIADVLGEIPEHGIRSAYMPGIGYTGVSVYQWHREATQYSLTKATDSEGRSMAYWTPVRRSQSIDAALTLLPAKDIALLDITMSWEPNDANVYPAASVRWYPPHKSGPDWNAHTASGRTPALALCIAALLARAALAGAQP